MEPTSCLVDEEEGGEREEEREKEREGAREREGGGERERGRPLVYLTAFQDLLPIDMRLGCPPFTEVQGNNAMIPSHELSLTLA